MTKKLMAAQKKIALWLALAAIVFCMTRLPLDARLMLPNEINGTSVDAGAFPKTLRDPLGREQVLQQAPQRIASAILAADEMFLLLQATDRVVSITDIADDDRISNAAGVYPANVVRSGADTEALLMTTPDLVVVAGYSEASTVRQLLAAGVTVLRLPQFDSFADIEDNVMTLARAIGEEARGTELVATMHSRLAVVAEAVKDQSPPRVLYYSPSGSATGANTINDEMITRAGGFNVIRDTGTQGTTIISQELAIALQPDVIILDVWGARANERDAIEAILQDAAWRDVPAVRTRRVYMVDSRLATTCTPFRAGGVEVIARLLHPSRFEPIRFTTMGNAHGHG